MDKEIFQIDNDGFFAYKRRTFNFFASNVNNICFLWYTIFIQDKVIRVSVFLQENIQNNDGSIVISNKGVGGVFVQTPGIIMYVLFYS